MEVKEGMQRVGVKNAGDKASSQETSRSMLKQKSQVFKRLVHLEKVRFKTAVLWWCCVGIIKVINSKNCR